MRYLFTCIFMMLALPAAAAQPGKECRGKQTFELSDGTTGCLLQLDTANITRTLSRDDGQSKSQKKQAVLSVVGLYGKFDTRMRVTSKRMKEICTAVMPAMQQKNGGRTPNRVVVQMVWPGVALPKPTRANGGTAPESGGGAERLVPVAAIFRKPDTVMRSLSLSHAFCADMAQSPRCGGARA